MLKILLERIECELHMLDDDDGRETGVSSRTIVSLGLRHGMHVYIMAHGHTILQRGHDRWDK